MARRSLLQLIIVIVLLVIAACAPEDLDITPTAAPSATPSITVYVTGAVAETGTTIELPAGSRVEDAINAVGGAAEEADLQRVNLAQVLRDGEQVNIPAQGDAETTPEAAEDTDEAVPETQALLNHIVSSIPGSINAGVISWRRDTSVEPLIVDRDGGLTAARITFNEAGGGLMELTFGVFDSPEEARAYYDSVRSSLRTLERAEERDTFPTPNAFGGGTYGSDAIFAQDNIFIRVSVPRFSSTAGDPLTPMGRQVFTILDEALASYSAAA